MHPALRRLVAANTELEIARAALTAAEEYRRQCALDLADIEDLDERQRSGVFAYQQFGKGLSLALAEAVTGLPGKKGQSAFLVLAGRRANQPKGYGSKPLVTEHEPMTEWPPLDPIERDIVASHIRHHENYSIHRGLGWTALDANLNPTEAREYLNDPTGALAEHYGVSREGFVEWLSSEGHVSCEGSYQNGKPCSSRVAGLPGQLNLQAWKAAKAKGGYCRKHGGGA